MAAGRDTTPGLRPFPPDREPLRPPCPPASLAVKPGPGQKLSDDDQRNDHGFQLMREATTRPPKVMAKA
jgi:hypothetical protein